MVLSKRERYIAIGLGAALGLLLLDQFITGPLLAQRSDLVLQIEKAKLDKALAERVIQNARHQTPRWEKLQEQGLRRKDGSQADAQIYNGIREWASDARMNVLSVKPERTEKDKYFQRITYRATGAGTLSEVSRFLYHIQTADIPVRVTDVMVNARKEGIDDLTISLGVSTTYLLPETDKDKEKVAASPNTHGAQQ